jgi:hypothetical protein
MSRQPVESIEAFFNRIDTEREAASSQINGGRVSSYPPFHGGPAQSLNDSMGEFLAAFAVCDDELARVGPLMDPNAGDSQIQGPSGVLEQHVVSSHSPGADLGTGSEVDEDARFDEGWDSYYSDSLSESEDEAMGAMDQGPIETMDMAELGRRPCTPVKPAPSYYEILEEARRLRSSITRQNVEQFFGVDVIEESVGQKLLGFMRALDLHNVSRLGHLRGVSKLRGGRRVNMRNLAVDLDLKVSCLETIFKKMRIYTRNNEKAPKWICDLINRFSLHEGRKSVEVQVMPGPSNADATNRDKKSRDSTIGDEAVYSEIADESVPATMDGDVSFSTLIDESKHFHALISDAVIKKFFGNLRHSDDGIRRNVLAFLRVLARHKISRLKDLPGAPELPSGNIDPTKLSRELGLTTDYFRQVRDRVVAYERKNKTVPNWMYVVLKRLSLDNGLGLLTHGLVRGPSEGGANDIDGQVIGRPMIAMAQGAPLSPSAIPGPSQARAPARRHGSRAHPRRIVRPMEVKEPSNATAFHDGGGASYSVVLEEAKTLALAISDADVSGFFGTSRSDKIASQRKVLAFMRALDKHHVSKLDDLIGLPPGQGGSVSLAKVADDLGLSDHRYFSRLSVKRYEKKGKPVPKWLSDILYKFSINMAEGSAK